MSRAVPLLRLALPCVALLAQAAALPPAPDDLDDFTWTYSGDPSGLGTVNPDSLHIVGPAWSQCTTGDMYAWLISTAPAAGKVSAHFFFDNQDGGMGWWAVEDPVYVVNGVMTEVGPGDIYSTWEGDVTFDVGAGDVFGFGVATADCYFGPGVLDVTSFSFEAKAWADLGQGLAGSHGVPKLVGLGPLTPGSTYTLSLVDALESAAAWLVVGVAQLGAPFKGGVLVPDPAPPGALLLLATSPHGRIVFDGVFPAGLPSGFMLILQYWIVDAAGPAGWSASNAVSATTP